MQKRRFFSVALLLLVTLFSTGCAEETVDARVARLHKKMFTIDTHNDFSMWLATPDGDFGVKGGQVSFQQMHDGGLDAAFFAAYQDQGPIDTEFHRFAREYADTLILLLKQYAEQNSELGAIATSIKEMKALKRAGKVSLFLSIENACCLGDSLPLVRYYYDQGVRMIGLTHNGNNAIADAGTTKVKLHGGLSDFGKEAIAEMNRLGIVIDLSHASRDATLQAVRVSKTPIIASHSCVFAVRELSRNLTDEEILAIAENGGVIHLALDAWLLHYGPDYSAASLDDFMKHLRYIIDLVGIDHVGVGSDFDGGGGLIGCKDMSEYHNLTQRLIEEGFSDEDIIKIWGGNFLRVFEQVERYAKEQR
jgi:microsomal dipeptidase-like Zn-dependent dipeptidase